MVCSFSSFDIYLFMFLLVMVGLGNSETILISDVQVTLLEKVKSLALSG